MFAMSMHHETQAQADAIRENNRQIASNLRDALAQRFPAYVWVVRADGSRHFYVHAKTIKVQVWPEFKGKHLVKVGGAHSLAMVRAEGFANAVLLARQQAATAAAKLLAEVTA